MITRRRHILTPPPITEGTICISRRAAFGDVICATVIADEIARLGFKVQFNTLPQIQGILHHHPSITRFGSPDQVGHVRLDDTYEVDPKRRSRLAMSIFYQHAKEQLARSSIRMRQECNLRPQLALLPREVAEARASLEMWPKPWTVVVPRSNGWINRTVPQSVWSQVACNTNGTLLWTGTDPINDRFIVDMRCKDMRKVAALMAAADLVVGVDTGPMWCAVGVNTPILGISQARAFRILMNDQVDWQDTAPAGLDCIGCSEFKCPISATEPPCQRIDPSLLATSINARLDTVTGNKVSAVIPCLHDKEPRILRCLEAVIDQVDEVVFSLDGAADGSRIPAHPKVRIVRSPGGVQTGFGKTCNRGARQSTGRYILFLNDDLYLDSGAVRAMKRIAAQPDTAIVGGLWRYPDGTIQHGGGRRGHGDVGFGHLDWKVKTPSLLVETEMEFVTAACFLVRREAFFKAGAFSEEYGNYSEDADLCMKVRQAGWKVVYQPNATGVHDESQTTSRTKQDMLKAAHMVFREKWQRYFTHNPPGALGIFT